MTNETKEPSVDLALCAKTVGGDEAMAKELITMLKNALPQHQLEIEIAIKANNHEDLQLAVHKLHGATCYTGTPKLKALCQELEDAAKSQSNQMIEALTPKLFSEINNVLACKV